VKDAVKMNKNDNYLTLTLDYPNLEVINSIRSEFINKIITSTKATNSEINNKLDLIREGNITALFELVNFIRRKSTYHNGQIYSKEMGYQEILSVVIMMAGFKKFQRETPSSFGRSDLALYVSRQKSYIMELKLLKDDEDKIDVGKGKVVSNDGKVKRKKKVILPGTKEFRKSGDEAIKQIINKRYYESTYVYQFKSDEIILIGVVCVENDNCRQIKYLKFETLDKVSNTIIPDRGYEIIL
jgi:hypothetical protein